MNQMRYINRILDRFEMANCRMRSTPFEVGHKPHAIQADEQPFDIGMYQKAVESILCAAHSNRQHITYDISVLGRYVAQPSTVRIRDGSALSLRVPVPVRTQPLPYWLSWLSIIPNCQVGYGSMVNSQPV